MRRTTYLPTAASAIDAATRMATEQARLAQEQAYVQMQRGHEQVQRARELEARMLREAESTVQRGMAAMEQFFRAFEIEEDDSYEYDSGSEYEPEPYTQTPANRTPSPSSTTSQPPATPTPAPEERESTRLSLRTISSLQSKFEALKTDFKFPSSIDFIATDGSVITLPSNSNSNSTPSGSAYNGAKLAFTPTNSPIRAYDEELNKILVKLDAVESCGVERVRERRKAVVRAIEQEAGRVEEVWKNVWEKYGEREKMNGDGIIKSPTSDSELLEGTRSSDLGVGSTVEESSIDSESVPVVDVDASTIANTNSSSSAPISVITILEPVIEELADGVEAALKDPLDFVDLTPSLDSHSDGTLQSESDMELDDSDSDDESVERSVSDLQSEDGSERDFVML